MLVLLMSALQVESYCCSIQFREYHFRQLVPMSFAWKWEHPTKQKMIQKNTQHSEQKGKKKGYSEKKLSFFLNNKKQHSKTYSRSHWGTIDSMQSWRIVDINTASWESRWWDKSVLRSLKSQQDSVKWFEFVNWNQICHLFFSSFKFSIFFSSHFPQTNPNESFRIAEMFEIKSKLSENVKGFINRSTSGMGYILGFKDSKIGIVVNTLQLESLLKNEKFILKE